MGPASDKIGEASLAWGLRQKLFLVCEVLLTYCRVRVVLWRHDLPSAVRYLRATSPRPALPAAELGWAWRRYGNVTVRTLEALPTDSRCLMRSLTLMTVLWRRGVRTNLVIGVKHDQDFQAHAWIERNSKALLWPGDGYAPITTL